MKIAQRGTSRQIDLYVGPTDDFVFTAGRMGWGLSPAVAGGNAGETPGGLGVRVTRAQVRCCPDAPGLGGSSLRMPWRGFPRIVGTSVLNVESNSVLFICKMCGQWKCKHIYVRKHDYLLFWCRKGIYSLKSLTNSLVYIALD